MKDPAYVEDAVLTIEVIDGSYIITRHRGTHDPTERGAIIHRTSVLSAYQVGLVAQKWAYAAARFQAQESGQHGLIPKKPKKPEECGCLKCTAEALDSGLCDQCESMGCHASEECKT